MRTNKIIWVCILIIILSVFPACNNTENLEPDTGTDMDREHIAKLYYANLQYIETGNELIEKYVTVNRRIEGNSKNIYRNVVLALKETPNEPGYATIITDEINIIDVYVKDKIAYVDISSKNLNGGSLQESFFIGQIVDTLIDSFEEIDAVQFLVEGEKVESLMGHIDATQAFKFVN